MSDGPKNYNLLTNRTDGGHIPPMPLWMAIIRVVQVVFALLVMALCAYSSSLFNGFFTGWGFAIFTFLWTWIFIAYIIVTAFWAPALYNIWAHLVLEALTVFWWLISFATLAVVAAYLASFNGNSAWRSAQGATGAGAAFAAFTWVSFIVTLVFFSISLHRHRKANLVAKNGGPVSLHAVEVGAGGAHKMTPMATGQVPQTYGQPQAQYQPVEVPTGAQQQYYGAQQVPVQGQHEPYGSTASTTYGATPEAQYGTPQPYGQGQQTHYGA